MKKMIIKEVIGIVLMALIAASVLPLAAMAQDNGAAGSVWQLRAERMLNITEKTINVLKAEGLNTSAAENLLAQAKDAYSQGDYNMSFQLAVQALNSLRQDLSKLKTPSNETNATGLTAERVEEIIGFINQSHMPEDVKARITARLTALAKNGSLTNETLEEILEEAEGNYTGWARSVALQKMIFRLNAENSEILANLTEIYTGILGNETVNVSLGNMTQLLHLENLTPEEIVSILQGLHKLANFMHANQNRIHDRDAGYIQTIYAPAKGVLHSTGNQLDNVERMVQNTVSDEQRKNTYLEIIGLLRNATTYLKEGLAGIATDPNATMKLEMARNLTDQAVNMLDQLQGNVPPSEHAILNQLTSIVQNLQDLVDSIPQGEVRHVVVGVVVWEENSTLVVAGYDFTIFNPKEPTTPIHMPIWKWMPVIPVIHVYVVNASNATIVGNVSVGVTVYVMGEITGHTSEGAYLVDATMVSAGPIYWVQTRIIDLLNNQ